MAPLARRLVLAARDGAALQQPGHRVHAATLTGLGERAYLLSPAITLDPKF